MKLDYGTFLKDRTLWQNGSIDEEKNQFTSGEKNAWRTVKPLPLPAMTKIIYTVPSDVMVRAVLCKKTDAPETGDVNVDYTFDFSASKWRMKNYEIYAGNTDAEVMFVVTYEDGHEFDFEQMPVCFYRPEKNVLPAYWVNALEAAKQKILARRATIKNPAELFYLTDTHWVQSAQHSPVILNLLSKELGIPHTVFGGDMIVRYNPIKECGIREVTEFFDWLDEDVKIFTTLGNHDRNYSSGNTNRALRFSEEETYEYYHMKQAESFAVMDGDPSHGYYDYPEQKLRMVQFYLSDSMFNMPEDSYVDGALDWVEKKILELEEGWTVMIFTHGYSRGTNPDGSFIITKKNEQIRDRVLAIKERARADVAFWITGHIHDDLTDTLTNGKTTIPLISVLSDGYMYSHNATVGKMIVGTDTEQAIDCIQIDIEKRKIYLTRIGKGSDREFDF